MLRQYRDRNSCYYIYEYYYCIMQMIYPKFDSLWELTKDEIFAIPGINSHEMRGFWFSFRNIFFSHA